MPDLAFAVEKVVADADAAAPLLMLGVRITCADPSVEVQSVALRCQVQIEATRRRYEPEEQARLIDLFGEPDRWSRTLRTLLWAHTSAVVPSFTGSTLVELPVPCTFDFNVAATKYFHSLEHGEVPLSLQFSGTIFYAAEDGGLQVAQIPWDKEANYRLPVAVWQEMMNIFYPNGAWLRLRMDVFERLLQYKAQRGIPTWEATIECLLAASQQCAYMNVSLADVRDPIDHSRTDHDPLNREPVKPGLVEQLASALLYEGYILYPYRASAVKNQQRFNFGGLYPPAYCEAQSGADAARMQTECLIVAGRQTTLSVRVRFLHLLSRQIGRRIDGDGSRQDAPAVFEPADSVEVAGRNYYAWQEAVEREVPLPAVELHQLSGAPIRHAFSFPASRTVEPLSNEPGETVAIVTRAQAEIVGSVEIAAVEVAAGLFRVRIAIENLAPSDGDLPEVREVALLRSLTSTHTILSVAGGEFVSLLDPPEEFRAAAAACKNVGNWPVLVGGAGQHDTMLASPIILYDYPQIAPESAGDMFDGTEIDEILTLRILLLTDAEKREMCEVDERARQILQRTEMLPPEQLWKMHGAVRGLRPAGETTP